MVQKYLVAQYCKNEVFGLSEIVDDFGYKILHPVIENSLVHNNEVHFWFCFYLYYFYFVEKMSNFQFVFVRIVVDHENLLILKSVVVYSDFVKILEYLSLALSFLVHLLK